jgi:hypothetical protein
MSHLQLKALAYSLVLKEILEAYATLVIELNLFLIRQFPNIKNIRSRQISGAVLEKAAIIGTEAVHSQRQFRFVSRFKKIRKVLQITFNLGIPRTCVIGYIINREKLLKVQITVPDIFTVKMNQTGFGDFISELC